jgi:hypothetical protein
MVIAAGQRSLRRWLPRGLSSIGAVMTVDVLAREERVARARLALAHAELRTGARSVRMSEASGPTKPSHPPEHPARAAEQPSPDGSSGAPLVMLTAAALPVTATAAATTQSSVTTSTAVTTSTVVTAAPVADALTSLPTSLPASPPASLPTSLLTAERPPLPVPPQLEALLPDGLRRGATTAVVGSTSLTLALLAAASSAGAWAAVVGQPSLGLLAAAEAGVALERLAVVPRPGADAAVVLGALLDGMDVVLVGPEVRLGDADRRRLSARARERGSVLLASVPWSGAGVVLTVEQASEHGGWTGLGDGEGRLRAQRVRVARAGRSSAAVPMSLELTLPLTAAGVPTYDAPTAQHDEHRARRDDQPDLRLVG